MHAFCTSCVLHMFPVFPVILIIIIILYYCPKLQGSFATKVAWQKKIGHPVKLFQPFCPKTVNFFHMVFEAPKISDSPCLVVWVRILGWSLSPPPPVLVEGCTAREDAHMHERHPRREGEQCVHPRTLPLSAVPEFPVRAVPQ